MTLDDDFRKAKFYSDLADLPEDERITLMGHYIVDHNENVTILTDDWEGKLTRYITKLTKQFPLVEVYETGPGPVKNVVYFKARKKSH